MTNERKNKAERKGGESGWLAVKISHWGIEEDEMHLTFREEGRRFKRRPEATANVNGGCEIEKSV